MDKDFINGRVFIVISLFLLANLIIFLAFQVLFWFIIVVKSKKQQKSSQFYQQLLQSENYDCQVKKVKFVFNFCNYNKDKNILRLKTNDYKEKTDWNLYRNLLNVLVIKWNREQKNTAKVMVAIIVSFYLSVIANIICALIYFVNWKINNLININTEILSIFCFISLISLILTWVAWTLTFDKVKKEILILAKNLESKEFKLVKYIATYKVLFPGSELLF